MDREVVVVVVVVGGWWRRRRHTTEMPAVPINHFPLVIDSANVVWKRLGEVGRNQSRHSQNFSTLSVLKQSGGLKVIFLSERDGPRPGDTQTLYSFSWTTYLRS